MTNQPTNPNPNPNQPNQPNQPNPPPTPTPTHTRPDGRQPNQLRPIRIQNNIAPHALGSTLIQWGNTQIICAATADERTPRWMKDQNIKGGWLTAEYSMLPYSTHTRKPRDATRGKIEGRTQEIQRLIGRSLRAAINLQKIGQRTIWIDCDVLQADGGTRCAAITGSYIALTLALQKLRAQKKIKKNPHRHTIAAVSVGIHNQTPILDLTAQEDNQAQADLNIILADNQHYIEIQGTAEQKPFTPTQLQQLLTLAQNAIPQITQHQNNALNQTQTTTQPKPNQPNHPKNPNPHPTQPTPNQPNPTPNQT